MYEAVGIAVGLGGALCGGRSLPKHHLNLVNFAVIGQRDA